MTDNEKKFLEGLTKLTKETGIVIGGCGCCGSPYLTSTSLKSEGKYTVKDNGDDLEWSVGNE